MDQFVLGQPLQLFAEHFLQGSKHRVFITFSKKKVKSTFPAIFFNELENGYSKCLYIWPTTYNNAFYCIGHHIITY